MRIAHRRRNLSVHAWAKQNKEAGHHAMAGLNHLREYKLESAFCEPFL
jgi:hypothetical protein